MQPPSTRPPAPGWLRQLGAALTAVTLVAAVLAPIALGAGTAEAHTQTVERCSFDPIAGQHCWDENVPHTHTPPPTTAPPPVTTPPGQGHPGGTDNEQQDRPDPPATTPPGQGHPGGTDNEQQDRPDPPATTPPSGSQPDDESDDDDDTCTSGTFVSGDCRPRPEGSPSGSDTESEEDDDDDPDCPTQLGTHPHLDSEQHQHDGHDCHDNTPGHTHNDGTTDPGTTASNVPNDIVIDGETISEAIGSAEVTVLCQWAAQTEADAAPNLLRGQKLIEALGEYGVALACGDGAASYWHYVLDGDTSPRAFAEFGINVGLEIVCGAIAAKTVAAASVAGPVAVVVGAYVLIECGNAAGEISRWVVESIDYLVQRLSECDGSAHDAAPSPLPFVHPMAHVGRCLVHDDGSDDAEEEQPSQPQSRITEVPPVCARIDGDWLEVTWDEVSAQSMSRLRWWTVFWSVHRDSGGSIQERDYWLPTNQRSIRIPKPSWVTGGSLAEADWTVGVIASAGVGGPEPWASQRVTNDGGWAGSNGVGAC